jgi:hypothetical protein
MTFPGTVTPSEMTSWDNTFHSLYGRGIQPLTKEELEGVLRALEIPLFWRPAEP